MPFDQELQTRLDALWFRMPADTPDALKALRQRILLREFQIFAKGTYGATDATGGTDVKAERLTQVTLGGTARLPAGYAPAGVADAQTPAVLAAWTAAKLRCPVVFQQRSRKDTDWPTIVREGVTFPGEVASKEDRVYAIDFARAPLASGTRPDPVVVGDAVRRGTGKSPHWYNRADRPHARTLFTPEAITGSTWETLSAKAQSTFRVLAAVAEVETGLALDAINAWDTSVFSLGPFQHTAFPPPVAKQRPPKPQPTFAEENGIGSAELAPFLGYVAHRDAAHAERLFKTRGLWFDGEWGKFARPNLTFAGQLTFAASAGGEFARPENRYARDWLRTWHAIYRARNDLATDPKLREAMWPYERQRLYDILHAGWQRGAPPGATSLGDVFNSELSVALLLRWHVFRPAHIAGMTNYAPAAIVAEAGLDKVPVAGWTAKEEDALIAAFHVAAIKPPMKAFTSASLRQDIKAIEAFTHARWGPLSRKRDFSLFAEGLPIA